MTPILASNATQRLYWIAIGLFALLFGGSVIFSLSDLNESYKEYRHLEFPAWAVFFNAGGKVLGLAAIFYNKSRTLKDFAYAGFLFDLLLALGGHIAQMEIKVLLAIFGLMIWAFAFVMDRKSTRFQAETLVLTKIEALKISSMNIALEIFF